MKWSIQNLLRREISAVLPKLIAAVLISAIVLIAYFNVRLCRLVDEVIYASHFPTGDRQIDNLLIVKVDDKSLERLGQWPWDRSVFTRLIQVIAAADPSVIALDFAFESSRTKQGDVEFAEIVGKERRRLVLASLHADGARLRLFPELAAQQPVVGYVNTGTSDELESTVAFPCASERSMTSFPELIARTYLDWKLSTRTGEGEVRIPESAHPMYRRFGECALPVNFVGGVDSIRSISASDLLAASPGITPVQAGSIVIVGPYADPHGDVHYTPISRGKTTPGPLIVALAVNTALSGIPVYPIGYWALCLLTTGISFASVRCFVGRRRLGRAVVSFFLIVSIVFIFHYLAFRFVRYYIPATPLLLVSFVAFLPRILEMLGIEIEERP